MTEREVVYVASGSSAEMCGIKPGDVVLAVNGNNDFDILDYMYAEADFAYALTVKDAQGNVRLINVENPQGQPCGISFSSLTVDSLRLCRNRCLFCFVDQMPKGMRPSLYCKDDDYRLSFLYGNYITLSNLTEADLKRIISYRLTPLNISVHVTDGAQRAAIMGNKKAGDIMEKLTRLKECGIGFNLQFVLCPGLNDGRRLSDSLDDILTLLPAVESLSCVPVGLTAFRDDLYSLRAFNAAEAGAVIDTVASARAAAAAAGYADVPLCASDEFFVLSSRAIPAADYYGDYPQYENGVGMLRSFIDGIDVFIGANGGARIRARGLLVTGASAFAFIDAAAAKINDIYGTELRAEKIINNFFGVGVTVAGLICGVDIIAQLKGRAAGTTVFVPENMLRDGEDIFLDDLSLDDVASALNAEVYKVPVDGYEFLEKLRGYGDE